MDKLYDFIGIGVGPSNLSLAAITEDIEEMDGLFFEETEKLKWHPGMLIEGTDLQTPFYADLVTFADPTSRYSFLNYLHERKRLYPFFFLRELEIPRQEYNDYLQWAADQMDHLVFGRKVVDVIDKEDHYEVIVQNTENGDTRSYYSKHIVMATGAEPMILEHMQRYPEKDVLHTSDYLYEKDELLHADSITVVGSGQSAAEVFADLLLERENREYHLSWLTRSPGIFQKEEAKIAREFYSPEFTSYFHSLPLPERKKMLDTLSPLYSEIDAGIIDTIYDKLYEYSIGVENPNVTIQPLTEVNGIQKRADHYVLHCHQWQKEETFDYQTEKVILATGYQPQIPGWFLERFEDQVKWEDDKLFQVGRHYQLQFNDARDHRFYVNTNIEHTHGTSAASLGLAAQRNMEMINHMLGLDYFDLAGMHTFQQFTNSGLVEK